MHEQVHEQLMQVITAMDTARKHIVMEGQPLVKAHQEALRALAKAKERFYAKSSEHEQLELALRETEAAAATDTKKRARIPEMQKKLARAQEEMDEAAANYQAAIATANARQDAYKAKMPVVLAEYRSCLAARADQLRHAFLTYAAALARAAKQDAKLSPDMLAAVSAISETKDIEELAQKCEEAPPPVRVFEPFVRGQQQHKTGGFSLRRSLSVQQSSTSSSASASASTASATATDKSKAHFRVPLEVLCERQDGDKIPRVVRHLVDQVLALGGAHARGIFRLAGDSGDIQEWRQTADTTGEFKPLSDPHNCAVLLKLWLRSLPEPLIPDALYAQATSGEGSAVATFGQLPEPNKTVAGFIISFLQFMSKPEHAADTKMDEVNLAAMFAPCLLRCPFEDNLEKTLICAEKEKAFVLELIDKLDTSGFPKFKVPSQAAVAINIEGSAPPVAISSPPAEGASTSASVPAPTSASVPMPPQRTFIGSTRGTPPISTTPTCPGTPKLRQATPPATTTSAGTEPAVASTGTPKAPRPAAPHKPIPPPPSAPHS